MKIPAKQVDEKGRCCGRKPIPYRRPPTLFCPRCDACFDPRTGKQIQNWAYLKIDESTFRCQKTTLTSGQGK